MVLWWLMVVLVVVLVLASGGYVFLWVFFYEFVVDVVSQIHGC